MQIGAQLERRAVEHNSTFRQMFLDGRRLPTAPQPTWLGYSIGRWEGATLVVKTIGLRGAPKFSA